MPNIISHRRHKLLENPLTDLHLNRRQKCCNAGFASVVPGHILPDQCIEDFVAGASGLEFAESEKKEEVETVGHPVERGDASEDEAVLRNAVTESATIQPSCAIICVVAEDEAVDDCKHGQCSRGDEGAEKRTREYRKVLFRCESKQRFPARFYHVLMLLHCLLTLLLRLVTGI